MDITFSDIKKEWCQEQYCNSIHDALLSTQNVCLYKERLNGAAVVPRSGDIVVGFWLEGAEEGTADVDVYCGGMLISSHKDVCVGTRRLIIDGVGCFPIIAVCYSELKVVPSAKDVDVVIVYAVLKEQFVRRLICTSVNLLRSCCNGRHLVAKGDVGEIDDDHLMKLVTGGVDESSIRNTLIRFPKLLCTREEDVAII